MREYLRILGNGTLDTAYSDIYQVGGPVSPDDPIGAVPQAVVNSIILCETGGAARPRRCCQMVGYEPVTRGTWMKKGTFFWSID